MHAYQSVTGTATMRWHKLNSKKRNTVLLCGLLLFLSFITLFRKDLKRLLPYRCEECQLQETQFRIMEQRRATVNGVCQVNGLISANVLEVSGIKEKNISYCVVPKAGCTIYLRLFKYLNGQNNHTDSPLSIGKYEVHYLDMHLYRLFQANDVFVRSSLRAMTVRNPYTRLWSAYIDKLLLPDFWQTKGVGILKQFRNGTSEKSLRCGHDVTFQEFIKYVIDNGHSTKLIAQDKHWLPASDICDPCVFKPDIINKQESFVKDLKYTLIMSNMTHMINKVISDEPIEYEIQDEINYNFKIFYLHAHCINKLELSKRIWTALTLNGYIPASETFPENLDQNNVNAASLYEVVMSVRKRHHVTRERTKLARKAALKEAFSLISKTEMNQLQELYQHDFDLFGYSYDL